MVAGSPSNLVTCLPVAGPGCSSVVGGGGASACSFTGGSCCCLDDGRIDTVDDWLPAVLEAVTTMVTPPTSAAVFIRPRTVKVPVVFDQDAKPVIAEKNTTPDVPPVRKFTRPVVGPIEGCNLPLTSNETAPLTSMSN